jgi:hypothetical protein
MDSRCAFRIGLSVLVTVSGAASAQTIIDHTCTDLDQVPDSWILAVRALDTHYAHTSHGGQLTCGLEFIEDADPFYSYELGVGWLPGASGAWCIFDGQESQSYVTPDLYWETEAGMDMTRAVLDDNPTIGTSMWCWCTQCDYYTEAQVDAYLDSMSVLQSEYPEVTFVFFTGNAQNTGSSGYNRWLRNQQIRNHCLTNGEFLFDFEDLDSWWYNPGTGQWEHHTYSYSGYDIPSEHPQFYGDEYAHTTAESCEQKGRAYWWMMARIAGWGGTGIVEGGEAETGAPVVRPASSPCLGSISLFCSVPGDGEALLDLYSCDGRLVSGTRSVSGTCEEAFGNLPSGMYTAVLRYGGETASTEVILLR